METLTKDNLIKALKDGKAFPGTVPYVQAMANGSDQVIGIVNEVFVDILTSDKASLMSKLLVLRMFKDIFIAGNMDSLDKIDPEVEQVLISAAAYNPNFRPKGKNDKQVRGGMYFVETEKRAENTQTIQLGNSFVLLATQIIKYFASWLPHNPDKTPSRFKEAYEELQALGVSFTSSIYFQSAEQKKFKANYQNWFKNRPPTEKTIPEDNAKKGEKQKKDNKPSVQEQQLRKELEISVQALKDKQNQVQKLSHQFKELNSNLQAFSQKKEEQINSLKETCKLQQALNEQLKVKVQSLQEKLSDSNSKTPLVNELQKQKRNLQEQLRNLTQSKNDAYNKIANLQKYNEELYRKYQQLKEQKNNLNNNDHELKRIQKQKELSQLRNKCQNLQTKISKLENTHLIEKENLLDQISRLKQTLVSAEHSHSQMIAKIQQKQRQNSEMKEQKQASRPLQPQIRVFEVQILSKKQTQQQFRNNFDTTTKQNFFPNRTQMGFVTRKSTNSLHKTQSTKLRQNKGILNQKKDISPLYYKQIKKISSKNVMTSIFPFLSQYFAPLNIADSANFRACCIVQQRRLLPFFFDGLFECRFVKLPQNPHHFQISIKNKTADSLSLKISSQSQQLKIKEGFRAFSISSFGQFRVPCTSQILNLNFRYPILKVSVNSNRNYRIPVPITLLTFTKLSQSERDLQKFDRYNTNYYRKYKSERIVLNSSINDVHFMFPLLKFEGSKMEGYYTQAIATYVGVPEIHVKLNVISTQKYCQFETEFLAESKISEAFSKVILQVLMFVCI